MVCLTIRTNFRYGWLQAFEVDVFGSPSGSPRACFQEIILGCPRCSGTCSSVSQVSNKWCEALSSVFLCSGGPSGSIPEVLHYQWHDRQKINIFRILGVKGTEFLNSPIYENECMIDTTDSEWKWGPFRDLCWNFQKPFRDVLRSALVPSAQHFRYQIWCVKRRAVYIRHVCPRFGSTCILVRIMNVL